MLTFVKREQGVNSLLSEGTVIDNIGQNGTINLIPKNLKDKTKRVAVILTKEDGTSALVSCSDAVSKAIRNGEVKKEHLMGFEILTGENGIPFISLPASGLITIKASDVKVKDYSPKAVTLEELVELSL